LDQKRQDNITTDLEVKLDIIESQCNDNDKLDKLYEIIKDQTTIIVNQQNKIDKLFEMNENQNKILSKLESKIMFDWRKDILAYNRSRI
jgi:hypothetical protein